MIYRSCQFGFGMSGRLAITISIPPGKLAKIFSGVMEFVFVGSDECHCIRVVAGSWLGYCCRSWASRCLTATNKAFG